MIICITGMPGSGKSTAAEILKKKGFKVIELSAPFKELMKKQNIPLEAESIERFSVHIHKKFGQSFFIKPAIKAIRRHKGDVVITGIRNIQEVVMLREAVGSYIPLIALVAPPRIRYRLIMHRSVVGDVKNYREFLWRDKKNVKLGTEKAIASADMLIANTGTRKQLQTNLSRALAILKSKGRD